MSIARLLTAEEIARALDGRPAGKNRWRARCPAHDDRSPSFDITQAEGDKVLLKCWSGCPQDALIEALVARDLWLAPGKPRRSGPPTLSADDIADMRLFCFVYRDNVRNGTCDPTPKDTERYLRYRQALELRGVFDE